MWRTSICRLKTTLFPPSQMENFKCSLTLLWLSGFWRKVGLSLCTMAACSVWPGAVPWCRGAWYVITTIRSDINTDCESDLWQIVRHRQASLYYNVKSLLTFPTTATTTTSFQSGRRLVLPVVGLSILDFNTWYRDWNLIEYLAWCLDLWTELQ